MPETIRGNGATIEEAVAEALSTVNANHASGKVATITFDHGGVKGGTTYEVELVLND